MMAVWEDKPSQLLRNDTKVAAVKKNVLVQAPHNRNTFCFFFFAYVCTKRVSRNQSQRCNESLSPAPNPQEARYKQELEITNFRRGILLLLRLKNK